LQLGKDCRQVGDTLLGPGERIFYRTGERHTELAMRQPLYCSIVALGLWQLADTELLAQWVDNRASTVGESYARGYADVVRSAGMYNLTTSRAMINAEEARRQNFENRKLWTDTYFQMRRMNREYTQAEKKPPASQEALVRFAQERAPARLNSVQLNPVTGELDWPGLLLDERYNQERAALDALFAKRHDTTRLSTAEVQQVREASDAMMSKLKETVRTAPPDEYLKARRFLESLPQEARFPAV
jgi:hypothetical protein